MASQKSISKGPLKPTILKGSKNPINKKCGPVEDAENLSELKHNLILTLYGTSQSIGMGRRGSTNVQKVVQTRPTFS